MDARVVGAWDVSLKAAHLVIFRDPSKAILGDDARPSPWEAGDKTGRSAIAMSMNGGGKQSSVNGRFAAAARGEG
jgi:hypothetical protein